MPICSFFSFLSIEKLRFLEKNLSFIFLFVKKFASLHPLSAVTRQVTSFQLNVVQMINSLVFLLFTFSHGSDH